MAKKQDQKVEIDLGVDADGNIVTALGISLNVGSGLNDAVKVSPISAKLGDEVYVAVRAKVVKVRHEGDFDDQGDVETVTRVLMLKALGAAFVDGSKVRSAIQSVTDRVAEAKALAKDGQLGFGIITEDDDEPKPGARAHESLTSIDPDLKKQVDEAMSGGDAA